MFSYIYELCKSNRWFVHRLNGYLDHIHILLELPGEVLPSIAMQKIKGATSRAFKGHKDFPLFEGWSEGYASFTVSYGEIDKVKEYIKNQEIHHSNQSFEDERTTLLRENGLEV